MKILYSAGNRPGAEIQFLRIKNQLKEHEIRLSSYIKSSSFITHVDWILDAAYYDPPIGRGKRFFKHTNAPNVNYKIVSKLVKDIEDFAPDLIICDMDPIVSNIAELLNIKYVLCSPIHALEVLNLRKGDSHYSHFINSVTRKQLRQMPSNPTKKIVYSPFCMVPNFFENQKDYLYAFPDFYKNKDSKKENKVLSVISDIKRYFSYLKILNFCEYECSIYSSISETYPNLIINNMFDIDNYLEDLSFEIFVSMGDSCYLMDALMSNMRVVISPNVSDSESILNAIMLKKLNLGVDVGQIELMNFYGPEHLDEAIKKTKNNCDEAEAVLDIDGLEFFSVESHLKDL